jgi:hypothetical protein
VVPTVGTLSLYTLPLYHHYFDAIRLGACSPFTCPPHALLHQPRSRNSQIFPKRAGSRRSIFASWARDLTRLILPSPRPALSALTRNVPWTLWRRAVSQPLRLGSLREFGRRKRGELSVLQPFAYQTRLISPISTPRLTNS